METVKIKKGVKPYGGRTVEVVGRETYPNGREVVRVKAPGDRRGGWMHSDVREYNADEVEALPLRERLCTPVTVEQAAEVMAGDWLPRRFQRPYRPA